MNKSILRQYAVPALFGMMAAGMKLWCDAGGPGRLDWILFPLSELTGFLSGSRFEYNAALGYLHESGTIALGPTCSGLTFMLILYLLTLFVFTGDMRPWKQALCGFFFLAVSCILSLLVNASRIAVSMKITGMSGELPILGSKLLHEATGVLYFLLALIAWYLLLKKLRTKTLQA